MATRTGIKSVVWALQKRLNMPEAKAYNLIRIIFRIMKDALGQRKSIKLPFGTLHVIKRKQYRRVYRGTIVNIPKRSKIHVIRLQSKMHTHRDTHKHVYDVSELNKLPWD